MQLFRPVGLRELQLIAESGYQGFPPRLAGQPIFYPVLNREYATSIAREWNTKDAASGYCGFVTAFEVDDAYVYQFPIQQVGASQHLELWVPASELPDFNRHIVGEIQVVDAFYGPAFAGEVDAASGLPWNVSKQSRPQ